MLRIKKVKRNQVTVYGITLFNFFGIMLTKSTVYGERYEITFRGGHISVGLSIQGHANVLGNEYRNGP